MKKISYLLLAIFLTTNYSCSKDDTPKQEEYNYYNFKIVLEFSGDYLNYEFKTLAQATTNRQEMFRNNNTGEQALQLQTSITESSYEFETVNDAVGIIFNIIDANPTEKNAYLDFKIYRDDKLYYEETVTFSKNTVSNINWTYWDDKILRVPEI